MAVKSIFPHIEVNIKSMCRILSLDEISGILAGCFEVSAVRTERAAGLMVSKGRSVKLNENHAARLTLWLFHRGQSSHHGLYQDPPVRFTGEPCDQLARPQTLPEVIA